jgi:hypothetical protein
MVVYDIAAGRYQTVSGQEPIVRSARRSAGRFEDGLILTRYGKTLRWGEGWWIDHPAPDSTPQHLAIAAQLRQIRDADPSQQPPPARPPRAGEPG